MSRSRIIADIDDTMLVVLVGWGRRRGRCWKSKLLDAWMTGEDARDPR